LKFHGFKMSLLLIVDNYESLNEVYQSEGHPMLMRIGCLRNMQQSLRSIWQCHLLNFTFSGPSLINHNMYAVNVRDDGGFGVTKKRFNIDRAQ
jgi:hypothetical protein